MDRISDPTFRCIYVQAPFNSAQLREYVEKVLATTREKYPLLREVKVTFTPNMYCTVDGNDCGYGFLLVSSSSFAAALCGLNLDGSPRVQKIPDPKWVDRSSWDLLLTVETLEKRIEDADDVSDLSKLEEELQVVRSILETGQIPQIWETQPALVELHPIIADEFQQAVMISLHEHMQGKTEVNLPDKDGTYVPEFEVAHAYPAKPGYRQNQLIAFADQLPAWVTPKRILKEVRKFSSRPEEPEVTFQGRDTKRIFVTFHADTKDAIFARLFLKNLHLTSENGEDYQLSFTFARLPDPSRNRGRGSGRGRGRGSRRGR